MARAKGKATCDKLMEQAMPFKRHFIGMAWMK